MCVDLIELHPGTLRSSLWISDIFQHQIRKFDGCLNKNTFPVFIVHGDMALGLKDRSLNFRLFSYLNQESHSFGLIHLYDENYDHDSSSYYLEKCVLVFRNFFRPQGGMFQLLKDYSKSFFYPIYSNSKHSGIKLQASKLRTRYYGFQFMKRQYLPSLPTEKIFHFPLGYIDRFAREKKDNLPKITDREYKWSFCGDSFKTDRKLMLEYLSNCQPNFIHEYKGFTGKGSLSGEDYWIVLTKSIFIPCPFGNVNIDSYRLFEALEAGAIPIILISSAFQPYDYYKNLLGEHPIPTFSSWQEVKLFLDNISITAIEQLSEKVSKWYANFKFNLKQEIRETLLKTAKSNLLSHDVKQLDKYM